jgi:hypothetical protein
VIPLVEVLGQLQLQDVDWHCFRPGTTIYQGLPGNDDGALQGSRKGEVFGSSNETAQYQHQYQYSAPHFESTNHQADT